jgi:TPR repeat protein
MGDAHGRSEHGRCLLFGIGGGIDTERGCALLESALDAGWEPARKELERFWYASALQRLNAATDAGDPGIVDAVRCLRQAAQSGHRRAAWMLGQCFRYGTGTVPNASLALHWYRRAGQLVDAQLAIAEMLYFGNGIAVDRVEAVEWYRRAAREHRDAHAMYSLGFCLLHGEGVAADLVAGVRWLEQAARQGDANAAWELARHFLGVQPRRAMAWLRRAAALGHAEAVRMQATMTNGDR